MTVGSKIDGGIDRVKALGKKAVEKAKAFAGKHKAALIASGALGAAGLAGGYAAGRKKPAKTDD